jgi:hypothetical protein
MHKWEKGEFNSLRRDPAGPPAALATATTSRSSLMETKPPPQEGLLSFPVPRNRERSLHTCAQDVQITRMATI